MNISAASGLGTGFVALNASTLGLTSSALTLANELRISGNATFAFAGGANTLSGPLKGSGNLALHFPAGGQVTLQGNLDEYAGGLSLTGTGAALRFNPASGAWGGADLAFDAGAGTIFHRATADTTILLGTLTGAAGSQLRGSDQAGPGLDTYEIGALNTSSTFAGSIFGWHERHPAPDGPHQNRHGHPDAQRHFQLQRRHGRFHRHPDGFRHAGQHRKT